MLHLSSSVRNDWAIDIPTLSSLPIFPPLPAVFPLSIPHVVLFFHYDSQLAASQLMSVTIETKPYADSLDMLGEPDRS